MEGVILASRSNELCDTVFLEKYLTQARLSVEELCQNYPASHRRQQLIAARSKCLILRRANEGVLQQRAKRGGTDLQGERHAHHEAQVNICVIMHLYSGA